MVRVQPLQVAIVGLGRIGAKLGADAAGCLANYASTVRACTRLRLQVGIDTSAAKRNQFEVTHGVPAGESLAALLRVGIEPDLFIVCTSTPSLVPVTSEILVRFPNSRVLVEKPLAYSQAAINTCRSWADHRVRVGYTRAFLPSTARMKAVVAEQGLGRLLSVEGQYSRGFANNCSHLLDLMTRTLGRVCIDHWAALGGWHPPNDVSVDVQGRIYDDYSGSDARFNLMCIDDPDTTVASLVARFEFGEIRYEDLGGRIEVWRAEGDKELIITNMDVAIGAVVSQLADWLVGKASLGCTLDEAIVTSRLLSQVVEP